MGEWKAIPLSEVADLLPGYAFKGMDFGVGTSRGVKIKDVQTGVVAVESLDALDVTSYNQERVKKYRLNAGDHLITMTGNLGRVATIPDSKHAVYLNQRVAKLLPKANVVEDFLLYVIKSSDFIDYCVTHADSETAQPNISAGTILEYEFSLPPEDEQRAIASVLSSLDAKVDLLHRQNKTLEAMAEALFRQWFVAEAEDRWEEVLLGDLVEVRYGKDHKALGEGNIPVYGSGGVMRYAERALFEGESVLIPRKGSLNNVMYVNEAFWTVDTMFFTEMKRPYLAKFIYHFVKTHDLAAMNVGSAVPSMTTAVLNNMPLQIPGPEVFTKYEATVGPLYEKHASNIKQITSLTKLRDTLLPKLMSGEVKVEEMTHVNG